ncbi:MAG: hypothetical protein Q9175_005853 [Cornicularia normoerica]
MPSSLDSLSSTSLPFGADNHTHATGRRSGSVPCSVHHEYQPAIYYQGPQTYSALIANTQTFDAVSRIPIPPSSIKDIPRSHKKFLRQHRILFRILIVIFNISLIALTAAIVLGAVKAHQDGQNGAKCAAIIVGVFGFWGMVGSAAVIWLIWTGRKERARLEKRWADEERVKQARVMVERHSESQLRMIIRDRERSLSRSRSRGRDRDHTTRPGIAKSPSFRAMTSTPTSSTRMPDHNATHSPWTSPMDVCNDVDDDADDAIDKEKNKEFKRKKDSNHEDNEEEDEDYGVHDEYGKAQATQKARSSASTHFQDLDPLDSENKDEDNAETASTPDTAILEHATHSEISLPLHEPETLPALPDFGYTFLDTSSTYIDPSTVNTSPTASAPENPPPLPRIEQISSATDIIRTNYLPYNSRRLPPIERTPFHADIVRTDDLSTKNARSDNGIAPKIPGWNNGQLGSAQSDENFQAMLDTADDVGSDDEKDRQLRRQKSREIVKKWASTVDLEAEAGERVEKGKRLRELLERGIQRVAAKKKERREARV